MLSGQVGKGLYSAVGKRAFDILFAISAILTLGPFIILLAAIISADGHNPFFAHRRVGRDGKEFGCLKLRSMVPNAEQRLEQILASDPAARAEWDRTCKITNDPRVTPLGRLLRRTSLDELPQFWNVLRGDMSIVGPRPVTQPELSRYCHHLASYLAMRPGLTGPWQVDGRNDISYQARVELDARYHRAVSLKEDVRIIFATAFAVIKLTGR